MKPVLFLLISFPLLGALILALIGRLLSRRAVETIACTAVAAAFTLALTAFLLSGQKAHSLGLCQWFAAGSFQVGIDLYYDSLAAVMALMVTFVSGIVHLYSVAYMRREDGYTRYFCFLNLFVFAMLVIVTSGNLVFLYLGWETVGLCSYALIGYWYEKPGAANAGAKAFVVTRLGDVAFGIAIALLWISLGHLSVSGINDGAASLSSRAAGIIGFLLLLAAIGKSAQLPLAIWLPDAMAGPTPVSALIHAATMVTAGVYLLMRFFPIIQGSPLVMAVIALVGVITVCFGAFAALVQKDIKRILAYSTISQVGYMFLAVGAGDLAGSLFHLISHAFFKSLLFLAAGCVIQALHEEQDIFRMGGLRQKMPHLFWLFLAGTASLGAFPLTAGFFSKDRILLAVFLQPQVVYKVFWAIATMAAVITPLYAFRMLFIVFFGQPHASKPVSQASIPGLMTRVLWPLAVLSVVAGFLNLPVNWAGNAWLAHYLATVPGALMELHASPKMESAMQLGSALITIIMVIFAWIYYGVRIQTNECGEATFQKKWHDLFLNGFYLDRLYQTRITAPYLKAAGFLWHKVDAGWVDAGLDKSARSVMDLGEKLRHWATGRISQYVSMMVVGFTLILCGLTVAWWYLQI
ncbi:MAG: NADH-quinone oxidoreductase subunit L [Deltaproteobacteria bacterium]|nr:NADH-quinone oxidoreductase subunit L [Deltaproteobacteria bacterium]